jgi:hypothetical protein
MFRRNDPPVYFGLIFYRSFPEKSGKPGSRKSWGLPWEAGIHRGDPKKGSEKKGLPREDEKPFV